MSKLRVVQVSESAFSVQGHGVHTAFVETSNGLRANDEVVVQENTFARADIRHIHTVGPYSLVQLLLGRGRKIVSAHVVPASFIGSLKGATYWLGLATWYLRWFYNRAAAVIAVSDETAAELRAMGVKRPIHVVYNMIDTARYRHTADERTAARQKHGISPTATVVIGNGQVQPRKRVDTFIAIAKALPEMEFIWVGGMPFGKVASEQRAMQRLIDTAPDNVRFTGVVDLEAVREYLAAGDIFVMTSMQETFGLAIVEAAASGLPIVLRDIADYDHTFRPYALLCDESAFAETIQRLATDSAHYDHWKTQAEILAQRYDSTVLVRELIEIYRSVCGHDGIMQ